MTTLALDRSVLRTAALNALLCAAVVAVPAASHALALPLYRFEPMRLLLFAAILLTPRRNALALALGLPLVSWLCSGHPVIPKVLLIQGELALNVWLFFALQARLRRFVPAAALSVAASKLAYYAVKFVLIRTALLEGGLVATPWRYQLLALAIVLAGGVLIRSLWNPGRSRNGR